MKPNSVWIVAVSIVAMILSTTLARGAVLDFETLPGGGPPTEGMNISNQFQATFGIRFHNSDGSSPIIVQAGSPGFGFTSAFGDDTPAPGEGCGTFFLNISPTGPSSDLIVGYDLAHADVGGVILDIDGSEAWTIRALDSSNHVIDTLTLDTSTPHTGDALATPWAFHHASNDIASVRFVYTGAQAVTAGEGFDNFTFDNVPEPSAMALTGLGAVCVLAGKRRGKQC